MNARKLKLVGQDTEVEVSTEELEHDIDMHHARALLYEVAYTYIHSRIIDVEPDSPEEYALADRVKSILEERYIKEDYHESMWAIVEDLTINGELHQKIDSICRELGYHSDIEPKKEEKPHLNKYVATIEQKRWFEIPVLAKDIGQAQDYVHDRFTQEANPFEMYDEDFEIKVTDDSFDTDDYNDSDFAKHDATKYTKYIHMEEN